MQPTARVAAWSAWAGWAAVPRDLLERRRVRISLHELPPRRDAPIALYTPDQIRHLIRLETALGRWPPTAPPALWRSDARPYDLDAHWRIPDMIQNVRLERGGGLSHVPPEGPDGVSHGWDGAARGWAAGAVLLAVLLLLVRALERCLHRRLFKGRRRSSDEWPRPNVMATNSQYGGAVPPRLDDSDYQADNRDTSSNDLPPPYSECANSDDASTPDPNKPSGMEEPPPPYSACYFSNPKDGIPTVHFYSRRNHNAEVGQSNNQNQIDNDAAPSISAVANEDANMISNNCDVSCEENRELGVNQRCAVSSDRTIDTNIVEATTDAVEERRRRRAKDHVVQIEESNTQEIVVRV